MDNDLLQEIAYTCPHCWQMNTGVLDLSAPPDALIEDCSVCCRPILLTVTMTSDGGAGIEASRTE